MQRFRLGFTLGLALVGASAPLAAPASAASPPCRRTVGQGAAPTERAARLHAWERVAQATGNWPVQTDTFAQEKYRCSKAAAGWRCQATIVVCRNG